MENKDELKKCPFCGREVEVKKGITFAGSYYYIQCKCGVMLEGMMSLSEAKEAWNRRVNEPLFTDNELDYIRLHVALGGASQIAKSIVHKTNEELLRNENRS